MHAAGEEVDHAVGGLDATHAEPKGYLACTQTPDGMIHLLSSRVHYRFNLRWIEK